MKFHRLTKTFLAATAVLLFLVFSSHSANAAPPKKVKILVAFENPPKPHEVQRVQALGGKVKWQYETIPVISVEIPQNAVKGIRNNPNVAFIEPDLEVFLKDAELDNTWGVKRIKAGQPHLDGHKGAGVKVAVIDTGIDYTHPDLISNYAGGYDFRNNDNDPFDDQGHGTHVAGTICAADNDIGVVGAAPEVRLYALKAFSSTGSASYSDIIAAMEWCIANGMNVTNNSWGSSSHPGTSVKAVFDNAAAVGILSFSSAGNSGTSSGTEDNVGYPARFPSVIAVGATTSSDTRATFSSTGPDLELAAPGSSVKSTIIGGGYGSKSGTSMACPHAAGAAAVLFGLGIPDDNNNGMISDEIRSLLSASALDLGAAGKDNHFGNGLVDLEMAILFTGIPPVGEEPPAEEPPAEEPPAEEPPAEEPPASALEMKIASIAYNGYGGKTNKKHFDVAILFRDETGNPVAGVAVNASIYSDRGAELIVNGTTDSAGVVIFTVRNASKGTWSTKVLQATAPGFEWDGFNLANTYSL
ncbi:MAG TPA: S8 family serine peptidase [Planctomycetaceae bacterium]|nr:S8 family serine peptidase [Planctomycetaceae bacterium]